MPPMGIPELLVIVFLLVLLYVLFRVIREFVVGYYRQ